MCRSISVEDADAMIARANARLERQREILRSGDTRRMRRVSSVQDAAEAVLTPNLPIQDTDPGPHDIAQAAVDAVNGAARAMDNPSGVVAAGHDFERETGRLAEAVADLIAAAIKSPGEAIEEVRAALKTLRSTRRWRQIEQIGEALAEAGVEHPEIAYYHAAAKVELGELDHAETLVSRAQILAVKAESRFGQAEAHALRGRIWKQRFVLLRRKGDDVGAKRALQRAIEHYETGDVFNDAPKDYFHKVNVLALSAAGERLGWNMVSSKTPKALATMIRKNLTRASNRGLEPWDYGNLTEANLYFGDEDQAAAAMGEYLAHPNCSPFMVNATRRQLLEIWEVDPRIDGPLQEALDKIAFSALKNNASVSFTADEVEKLAKLQLSADTDGPGDPRIGRLEALLDGERAVSVRELLRAINMGRFVGAVRRPTGRPVGTGFLIPGDRLFGGWAGGMVFVTNEHVISDDPNVPIAVTTLDARIVFETDAPNVEFKILERLWSSPIREHDVAIFRLDGVLPAALETLQPIDVAHRLPPRQLGEMEAAVSGSSVPPPRVYVIGHPKGRPLEITVENNLLIDHEHDDVAAPPPPAPVRIHYRAPTEPGSSGSPVFNADNLQLIGVHHMASDQPLDGYVQPERLRDYEANEGLWIQA
ncbi:MAG: serine protease, partial [Pseudomonadota bacterium]